MLFVWKMWIIAFSVMSSSTLYLANISLLQCLGQTAIWVFCVPPHPRSTNQATSPRLSTDSPRVNKSLWLMFGREAALSVEKDWSCVVPTS